MRGTLLAAALVAAIAAAVSAANFFLLNIGAGGHDPVGLLSPRTHVARPPAPAPGPRPAPHPRDEHVDD